MKLSGSDLRTGYVVFAILCGCSAGNESNSADSTTVPNGTPSAPSAQPAEGQAGGPSQASPTDTAELTPPPEACIEKLDAVCNGECFTFLGEEKAGCKLIRYHPEGLAQQEGAFGLQAVGDRLLFRNGWGLYFIDLNTLEEGEISPNYADVFIVEGEYIYALGSSLQRMQLDGSNRVELAAELSGRDLSVADGRVYFLANGVVSYVPIDGSAAAVSTGISVDDYIVHSGNVYFTEYFSEAKDPIYRAAVDEPTVIDEFVAEGHGTANFLLTDGARILWSEYDSIGVIGVDGTGLSTRAMDGAFVKLSNDRKLVLMRTTASDPDFLVGPLDNPRGVRVGQVRFRGLLSDGTLDDSHIYVSTGDHGAVFQLSY